MIYIIYNPISGNKGKSIKENIALQLEKIENSVLLKTEYANHATELAKYCIAQKAERIIVVGGDGTINEVARQLIHYPIPLAIVPMGSGNGLASHLKLPQKFEQALSFAIEANESHAIDVAYFNDQAFFCTAGIGFDATVANDFSKSKKRGFFSYVRSSFKMALSYQPILAKEKNQAEFKPYFSISFANANQFGNNAFISPGSNLMDDQFEVVWVKPLQFFQKLKLGISLFLKTIEKQPNVRIESRKNLEIEVRNCTFYHLDGETFSLNQNSVRIEIIPQALKIFFKA